MNRRNCLKIVGTAALGNTFALDAVQAAQAHLGPVKPPVPAPDLPLLDHRGQPQQLRQWLTGQVTLVQTVFTACSSVCPVQGALFAQVQQRLGAKPTRKPVLLLSVSVDTLGDTPAALAAWLGRMKAQPGGRWAAALPRPEGVDVLLRALDGAQPLPTASPDVHSDRVYVFDDQAQLRWRSGSLPSVNELVAAAQHFAA